MKIVFMQPLVILSYEHTDDKHSGQSATTQLHSVQFVGLFFFFFERGEWISSEMWCVVKVIMCGVHRGRRYLLGPLYEIW